MLPFIPRQALAVALGTFATLALPAARSSAEESLAVQIRATATDAALGTAVLVAVDASRGEPVYLFVTSSRVFDCGESDRTAAVRLQSSSGESIDVAPDQIIRSSEATMPIVVIRVTWPGFAHAPVTIDLDAPPDRGVFVVEGFRRDGSVVEIPDRVQRRSMTMVSGDRAIPEMDAPLGAPAISTAGLFGIVTESEPGQTPVITLLSSVADFLSRYLPPDVPRYVDAPKTSLFKLTEKHVGGPLLSVACEAEKTGEIDVPYRLALNERLLDATASFSYARSVKQADLTVLALNDRTITLRFNLIGGPLPAFVPPGPCLPGRALVTVRMNVVSFPRQE